MATHGKPTQQQGKSPHKVEEEMANELDVAHDPGLRPADLYWDSDCDPMESAEDDDGSFDFSTFDTGGGGDGDDGGLVDFLDDEESLASAREIAKKLARTTSGLVSKSRRRRSAETLKPITVDDFDEVFEKQAFLIVQEQASRLLGKKQEPKLQRAALSYFFGVRDDGDATFQVCCDVLRTRADVLRTRIQYEWWLRFTVFSGPFDFMAVPVPAGLVEEIGFYAPRGGLEVARAIWVQPGVDANDVCARVAQEHEHLPIDVVQRALRILEERMFVSLTAQACYLTARNPLIRSVDAGGMHEASDVSRRSSTVHWSGLFAGW